MEDASYTTDAVAEEKSCLPDEPVKEDTSHTPDAEPDEKGLLTDEELQKRIEAAVKTHEPDDPFAQWKSLRKQIKGKEIENNQASKVVTILLQILREDDAALNGILGLSLAFDPNLWIDHPEVSLDCSFAY